MDEQHIQTLRASAAQVGAGTVTGTAGDDGLLQYEETYDECIIILDVTALDTDADDKLDVYIDISFDGGSTWVNVVHFAQQSGTESAVKFAAVLKVAPAVEDLHTITSDLVAGDTRQIGLGTQMRYRGVVLDPSGTNATFTYSIVAFFKG